MMGPVLLGVRGLGALAFAGGVCLLLLGGCNREYMTLMDVQGHRGARGHFPENTMAGFEGAIAMGATTLELDVVVSADGQVVVSHEPWLNADICLDSAGKRILPALERSHNLYRMTYDEIVRCDCGSLGNPRFPGQKKQVAHKPLLGEVLFMGGGVLSVQGSPMRFNIEVKREAVDDGVYYPPVDSFVDLVVDVVEQSGLAWERVTLQSFDLAVMGALSGRVPTESLALLVDEGEDYKEKLAALGYYPGKLSPWHLLVDEKMMQFAAEKEMAVVPWTVNEVADMERLIGLKVPGIITDYPDRLSRLLNVDLGSKGE